MLRMGRRTPLVVCYVLILSQWGCQQKPNVTVRTVDAQAAFELRGSAGRSATFSRIIDVAVGPDARLYVTDWLVPHVQVFDSTGELVDSIGRAGERPGEFRRIGSLGFVGDTLWVETDRRVNLYDLSGTSLGGASFYMPNEGGTMMRRPVRYAGSGGYHAEDRGLPRLVLDGDVTTMHVLRTSDRGEVLDTVVIVNEPGNLIEIRADDEWAATYILEELAPRGLAYFSRGRGLVAVKNTPPSADSLWISWLDGRGEVLASLGLATDSRPFPDSLRNSIVTRLADGLARDAWPVRRVRNLIEDQVRWPDYAPEYRDLIAGEDGRVWLHRYDSAGIALWDAIKPFGETTRVSLPAELRLYYADGIHVWGVLSDEFDVPPVWRFDLSSP